MVILKRRKTKKKFSDYKKYKPWLREDFEYACVYCTIHEGEFGGFHSFHVEHFKPKSKFPALETVFTNLLYACWRCNSFKGEDWPSNDPFKSGKGYLDPCKYNYDQYFIINMNQIIIGKVKAARYMIERLHLNCYFLIKIRKERAQLKDSITKHKLIGEGVNKLLKNEKNPNRIKDLNKIKSDMLILLERKEGEYNNRFTPPYEYKDLR